MTGMMSVTLASPTSCLAPCTCSRKTLVFLILTLNHIYPDYDFSQLRSNNFKKENGLSRAEEVIDSYLLEVSKVSASYKEPGQNFQENFDKKGQALAISWAYCLARASSVEVLVKDTPSSHKRHDQEHQHAVAVASSMGFSTQTWGSLMCRCGQRHLALGRRPSWSAYGAP